MKSQQRDVVITGIGPVTSIGVGAEALWNALLAGHTNVQRRALPVDIGVTADVVMASMPPAAEVPDLDQHLAFLNEQDCSGYRDLGYVLLAIELALDDAGLPYDRDSNRVGAVQAFEAPGVEQTVGRLFAMMSGPPPTDGPPKAYDHLAQCFYNMQPFLYVHVIGKAFGFRGFSTSVHNACSSGAFAIEIAAEQIRSGHADAMLVIGGEAFDTAARLEWFRRLELYARDEWMRPFDPQSSGFYVGEGAAAMVMESAEHARDRGATPYAKYLGGAFAQQSWKQTIPDVRIARLRGVITEAMRRTSVSAADLDLVVPHGAGTLLSDGYEAACLSEALDGKAANAAATAFKPYVGHMLACSALIEMICGLLSMKHGTVPATLHSDPKRVKLPIPLITETTDRPVKTLLKLTTGFTGHDAASLFAEE